MKKITRRGFLKGSVAAGVSLALPGSRLLGANDDIRVGIIGLGTKGPQHAAVFSGLEGVRVAAICDPDRLRLAQVLTQCAERGDKVDPYVDCQDLLDDKNIDAVVIVTPDHWHCLLTVLACQAGKDVYVEKPVSHNIWEGRKMVEAARKYDRIVQAGTQRRSDIGWHQALDFLKKGSLGKIRLGRAIIYRHRASIGKVEGHGVIPKSLDYDLWAGPAPMGPLMRKNLHYDWHWGWSEGNGEIGNNGIHVIDLCRFLMGYTDYPQRVMSIGDRFKFDDDGETPNTQLVYYDYESAPIICEIRNLPRGTGDPAMDVYRGVRVSSVIDCEGGYIAGGFAYDNEHNKISQFEIDGGGGHQGNFIKAVRSRNRGDLNADILQGHISTAHCHMGNISHRIGKTASPEQIAEAVKADGDGLEMFESIAEHLAANDVDLKETPATLGPWLKFDSKNEKFAGPFAEDANKLLRRTYRKPFVVPEQV